MGPNAYRSFVDSTSEFMEYLPRIVNDPQLAL